MISGSDLGPVATKGKDLRSGRSVWQGRRARHVAHERLARDIKTDVLIMGAGITGAAIADAVALAGVEVAVVDKRGLARGSTVASTALVQYEIDTPLITLARKIGKEKAIRAWRRSRLAADALAARLGELRVPDVTRRDSLYLAGNTLGPKELRRDARQAAATAPPTPPSPQTSSPARSSAGWMSTPTSIDSQRHSAARSGASRNHCRAAPVV